MQSPRSFMSRVIISCLACLLLSPVVVAQSSAVETTLPDWDRLSAQQRDVLIAPVRERWNARPERRARMLDHATRWRELTPEQRRHSRRGVRRWQQMEPAQQQEMRALYSKMRTLDDAGRHELRERWEAMTPEQRRAWVRANAPREKGGQPR